MQQLACAATVTALVSSGGALLMWGLSEWLFGSLDLKGGSEQQGQKGGKAARQRQLGARSVLLLRPTRVLPHLRVGLLALGQTHAVAVDGRWRAWARAHRTQVPRLLFVCCMAALPSELHRIAITTAIWHNDTGKHDSQSSVPDADNGDCWAWGSNEHGQLGNASRAPSSRPLPTLLGAHLPSP